DRDEEGRWRAHISHSKSFNLTAYRREVFRLLCDECAAGGVTVLEALAFAPNYHQSEHATILCPTVSDVAIRNWADYCDQCQISIQVICTGVYKVQEQGFKLPLTDFGVDGGMFVPARQITAYHEYYCLKDKSAPICFIGDAGNRLTPNQPERSREHLLDTREVFLARSQAPGAFLREIDEQLLDLSQVLNA
ncbi:MAG TPA: hypothetical protein VJB37_00900, partial [Patescibacteria group bacterium]|nr:hypothetical protein [Patescibacteria group bacterium]